MMDGEAGSQIRVKAVQNSIADELIISAITRDLTSQSIARVSGSSLIDFTVV